MSNLRSNVHCKKGLAWPTIGRTAQIFSYNQLSVYNSLVHDLKNVGTKVADERNEKVHCTRRGFSMNFILSR